MEVLGIRDEGCSAPSGDRPKDIEQNQCVLVRRDTREKIVVSLDELETAVPAALKAVHDGLYQKALENRQNRTWDAHNWDEFKKIAEEKSGFIRAMWCGDEACEDKIKDETGIKSRCIPFGEDRFRMSAYAAANLHTSWFTGADSNDSEILNRKGAAS